MRTQTIVSYWAATNFDGRINDFLNYLENNHLEIVEIQYQHNWFFYSASILYK